MHKSIVGAAFLAVAAIAGASSALAMCTIPETPCYPWRIDKDSDSTVILEILPNNVVTSANYRLCVCAPGEGVQLSMDFDDKKVEIGKVELKSGEMVCRDYRVMSSRKSRLTLYRLGSSKDKDVEGCYN